MSYHFIKSRVAGKDGSKSLSAPLVIDIRNASTQSGAVLQVYPQNSTDSSKSDTFNQQWEFNLDPAGSGYHFIQSKLDGCYITVPGDQSGVGLVTSNVLNVSEKASYLWRFVQDPAGSGYCFIQSLMNNFVIDIHHASDQERTIITAFPIKSTGYDNQLWQAPFPRVLSVYTEITWNGFGTGSGTTGGGSQECSYGMGLQIQQDGTCRFWGTYTNRGDTFASTAPAQNFALAIVVHDIYGRGYSFSYGGYVLSAPQEECTQTWDYTGNSKVITDNWIAIALVNWASQAIENQATGGGIGGSGLLNAPAGDINAVFSLLQTAVSAGGGGPMGSVFSPTPDTIFSMVGEIPYSNVASGDHPVAGGSLPPGWVPSGDGAVP
jgi:hypothetical protein